MKSAVALLKSKADNIITKRRQISDAIPGRVYMVAWDLIRPNPEQPRKIFDEESLSETAGSISSRGDVEDPIRVVVRNAQSGFFFMIVDGERRWRAAKIAGIGLISCLLCQNISDDLVYLSSAKANCDRESLNPIDEAEVVIQLGKRFGWNHARIAKELSKSSGYISNVIKYLALCRELRGKLLKGGPEKGGIDKAVALSLASFPAEKQEELNRGFMEETKGKRLNPRDISRVMKKVAKAIGVIPKQGKRGKKHLTHSDLVVSNFERAVAALYEAAKELDGLSDEEIIGQKSRHIIDLIVITENCHRRLGDLAERINTLD